MLTFALLVLLTLLFLLLLWVTRNQRPVPSPGGYGTRIEIPDFKPGPRPTNPFVEPPRNPVVIDVVRDDRGYPIRLEIGQRDLQLPAGEQAGWSGGRSLDGDGAKVEIRFSPKETPFGGASFSTSRSGNALSGTASRNAGESRKYIILATTPDGYLLTQTATVTPASGPGYDVRSEQGTPKGGYGTRVEIPEFTPGPRPGGEPPPPSREVRINVTRGDGGEFQINVEPEEVVLGSLEQVAWTTGDFASETGGKIEIRFAPNRTPFDGHTFVTARGGTALSGFPSIGVGVFPYKVLVTTPDGSFRLREQDASVRLRGR